MRSHKHGWLDIINGKLPTFSKVITDELEAQSIITGTIKVTDMEMGTLDTDTITLGDSPDYTYLDQDGIYLKGDSTVWEDIASSLIGAKLASRAGKVDYDYDENAVKFQKNGSVTSTNDRVQFNLQFPHAAKEDGQLHMHVHWVQTDALVHTWTLSYRIQNNGSATESVWTTVSRDTGGTTDAYPYVSGSLNQITEIVEMDMTGYGISAVVQFRLARTDGNGGNILATFVDGHFEKDTMGSRQEYIK